MQLKLQHDNTLYKQKQQEKALRWSCPIAMKIGDYQEY